MQVFNDILIFCVGGTVMPPPFSGYVPFAGHGSMPINGMTGKPDPRCPTMINDPNHMMHLHPAFYPQPILYWGYPSPPVSPTTYYGPPPPTAHLSPPNVPQTHQPALVCLVLYCFLSFKKILFFYKASSKCFTDGTIDTHPTTTASTTSNVA